MRQGSGKSKRLRIGGGFLAGAAAAVEHDAAGGEGGDADAGARAAIEQPGDVPGVDVEAVEGGGRHADGKRELGARAEAGMGWNGALDRKGKAVVEPVVLGDRGQIAPRPIGIMPADLKLRRPRQGDARQRRLEADAEAAETPAEAAVEIDESEMESGRYADTDPLGACRRLRRPQMLSLVA